MSADIIAMRPRGPPSEYRCPSASARIENDVSVGKLVRSLASEGLVLTCYN